MPVAIPPGLLQIIAVRFRSARVAIHAVPVMPGFGCSLSLQSCFIKPPGLFTGILNMPNLLKATGNGKRHPVLHSAGSSTT